MIKYQPANEKAAGKAGLDFRNSKKVPRLGGECHTKFSVFGRWLALVSHKESQAGLDFWLHERAGTIRKLMRPKLRRRKPSPRRAQSARHRLLQPWSPKKTAWSVAAQKSTAAVSAKRKADALKTQEANAKVKLKKCRKRCHLGQKRQGLRWPTRSCLGLAWARPQPQLAAVTGERRMR